MYWASEVETGLKKKKYYKCKGAMKSRGWSLVSKYVKIRQNVETLFGEASNNGHDVPKPVAAKWEKQTVNVLPIRAMMTLVQLQIS
jgi:hypothetical protein